MTFSETRCTEGSNPPHT